MEISIFFFEWSERLCAGTLETLTIKFVGPRKFALPYAVTLISKLKKIKLSGARYEENVQLSLWNCEELVELEFECYEEPFLFPNHRFPHLRKLDVNILWFPTPDFNQIETFSKNHTKLTALSLSFGYKYGYDGIHIDIDVSFVKRLLELEKFHLYLEDSKVEGIDAFPHLQNLKEFDIIISPVGTEYLKTILENLASVNSLVTLKFDDPNMAGIIPTIKRFKNLSKLMVTTRNILEPKAFGDVIRNLSELKIAKLDDGIDHLDESIFVHLANLCLSQKRKILFIIDDLLDYNQKFNKEHGAFLEIKISFLISFLCVA